MAALTYFLSLICCALLLLPSFFLGNPKAVFDLIFDFILMDHLYSFILGKIEAVTKMPWQLQTTIVTSEL